MNKRTFSPIIEIISGIGLLLNVFGTFVAWICECSCCLWSFWNGWMFLILIFVWLNKGEPHEKK